MEPTAWFYAANDRQQGPVSSVELRTLAEQGIVRNETLIWYAGLPNWQPFSTVRERVFAEASGDTSGLSAPAPDPGPQWVSIDEVRTRDYTIDHGARVSEALQWITKPSLTALWAVLVGFLCIMAAGMIPFTFGIVGLIVDGPLMGGVYLVLLTRARTGKCSVGDVFSGFGPRFGALVGGYILNAIICSLPMIPGFAVTIALLAAQGVFRGGGGINSPQQFFAIAGVGIAVLGLGMIVTMALSLLLIWTFPLIADKGLGPMEAMGLSLRVTRKHIFQMLLLFLIILGISLLGGLACGIGLLFALPLTFAIYASQYEKLFGDMQPKVRG